MAEKINPAYKLRSGKNSKLFYYLRNYLLYMLPDALYVPLFTKRGNITDEERQIIEERTSYYCKPFTASLPESLPSLGQQSLKERKPAGGTGRRYASVYFFDSYEYTRCFPKSLRWNYLFGDITHVPELPAIVKSRPIDGDNAFSVLLKLNKVRHFIFLNDSIPFTEKRDMAIFRGDVRNKENRIRFMQRWFGSSVCDAGDTTPEVVADRLGLPAEWRRKPIPIKEHLQYKFIVALEGNDVASNLKWIMSSNSLAIMPRPKYETWFMEGRLIPGFHYVEVADDFSDLEEKIRYYTEHPHEAEMILKHAHEFVAQFRNKRLERIISLNVMRRYFGQTGQL